ncbi:hypothetical protein [Candidatus Phytoplasma pini]|uniref:hypothetical protein n=1 Tax=Candidatus Phytoplasma pini TaxID=267362 RepID=UPI0011A1C5DA|nr:hypothetical protein [Candidatus Phytoplasma pini]
MLFFYFISPSIFAIKEEKQIELLPLVQKKTSNNEDFNIVNEPFLELNNDYKKSIIKKHFVICWKHNFGSFFSKKTKLFYDVESAKTIPCASFQEWLNFKQFVFYLLNHHIPKIDFLFDFLDISGIKDEFIDDKYEKVALDTTVFCRLLKKDPSLGFFYFDSKDLNLLESINISFCNCKVSGYSIIDLILEIINFKNENIEDLKKHFILYFKELSETINYDVVTEKELNISIEEFLDRIVDNTDIEMLDKKFLFHLIKEICHTFIPKKFSIHYSVDNINSKPLKEMYLPISCSQEYRTIGFLLKIQEEQNNLYLNFYEIFVENDDFFLEKLKLIDKVRILSLVDEDCVFLKHLSIGSVLKRKKLPFYNNFLFGAVKKDNN